LLDDNAPVDLVAGSVFQVDMNFQATLLDVEGLDAGRAGIAK